MQPDILETEITRQAREVVAAANRQIEARPASLDPSSIEGQHVAITSRFQRDVLSALLLWLAGENERGTAFPFQMMAVENGIANMIASMLASTVPPEHQLDAATQLLAGISRDLGRMLADMHENPEHPAIVTGRTVTVGRA